MTDLVHTVALPYNCTINSVLQSKNLCSVSNLKLPLVRENKQSEYVGVLTSISSSWYSVIGGLPSLLGFSTIGFRTTWGINKNSWKDYRSSRWIKLNYTSRCRRTWRPLRYHDYPEIVFGLKEKLTILLRVQRFSWFGGTKGPERKEKRL